MSRRYFVYLSYNGAAYCGWQRQLNALSVQQVFEEALSTILRRNISVTGAGRTDAGVHAKEMVAHFDADFSISEDVISRTNILLPEDIAVRHICEVIPDAHARFDAISRTYRYRITLTKDPFLYPYSYFHHRDLDWKLMNQAALKMLDHKNFQCFSKSNTDVKTDICHVLQAVWTYKSNNLTFTITADRFLRNMVRAIVGTLLEIGRHRRPLSWFDEVLRSGDRRCAGASVTAQALSLDGIRYPSRIFL